MEITLRHDRIIPLKDLSTYAGSEYLDMTLYLPWSKDPERRLWLLIPQSSPTISIDDTTLEPRRVSDGTPRWIDYGTAELPLLAEPNWALGEFYQLRIRGMAVSECADSYLVITAQLDLSLDGHSPEEAERELWGLARCDAGSTTLQPSRLTVGSAANLIVRYTAGPHGLPAGALVRFSVANAFSKPQVDDPGAPGFVSVIEADCEVSHIAVATSVESHEKTDIFCRLGSELAPSGGLCLRYSTDRTYIFPTDAFHETERRYWYSLLPPLAAAVALSESAPFVSLAEVNGHALEMIPGPSERLHLFLPGRRFSSEALALRGTFTDRYRNVPPTGPIDADIELWLEGDEDRMSLGSPAEHFVARHRFRIPLPRLAPGIYRAVARRPNTREEVARSNPLEIIPKDAGRDRIYWGEIHGHTGMSDGSGDFWELYRHAQDEGCLEFTAATDHAEYITDNQWQWMQDVTNAWNQPGQFVTLVGYETAGEQRDRCVYTSRSRLKLFRGSYLPTSELRVVWDHFHDDDQVVGGVHALVAHMINMDNWAQHDPVVERFIEVYSMWGANDSMDSPYVPHWLNDWLADGVFEKPGVTANELLKTGAKLGFTGGGDCHEGHCGFASEDPDGQGVTPHTFAVLLLFRCGMTAATIQHLDRVSLLQAVRNRRTYATTGARILLDFTVADLPMGTIGTAEEVECCATVHAVQPVQRIEIVKDGRIAWAEEFDSPDATVRWRDPAPPSGEHYYYLHVVQVDGHMAWSSPIWVRPSTE